MKAAVVGTFDGVHSGHRHLLATLRAEADARGLTPLALTFDCHPLSVIDPERVPASLTEPAARCRLIGELGVEAAVIGFDDRLRALTAREFLSMLRERYDVRLFLLGFNNRIGSDRVGADSPALAEIARACGVDILIADEHPDFAVSSSAIRAALSRGRVDDAASMLGRPYRLEGTVVSGRQLGRTIGFPTANLQPSASAAVPAPGVYAADVAGKRAVVNIGRRPTVEGRNDAPLSIEVHILDFCGDLYGQRLQVDFLKRLRGEKRFGSINELKAAIGADVEAARRL